MIRMDKLASNVPKFCHRNIYQHKIRLVIELSQLFGIFATHTPESCPLNNAKNKKIFFQLGEKVKRNLRKYKVAKVVGFYISILEHQWVIILEGENAHDIETLCIDTGISAFNTVKIVPLSDLSKVAKKMKN